MQEGVIRLRIAGEAKGKDRPRFNPKTKRTYTTKATTVAEKDIRQVWREAGELKFEGKPPLAITIMIYVVRPSSHFKSDGSLTAEGERHPYPDNKKPDVDNALKLVMDALNGRAYHDDVQVCRSLVERDWADWPETVILIRTLV